MLRKPAVGLRRTVALLGVGLVALLLATRQWGPEEQQPGAGEQARRGLLQPGLAREGAEALRGDGEAGGPPDPRGFARCGEPGLGPQASFISPSVKLSHVASRWSPGLGHVGGLSDPSIAYFQGHYVAAFTDAFVTKVYLAASPDGENWEVSATALDGYSWTSLFVHRGALYLIGPQGQLWFRKETTNDLQLSRLEFEPPAAFREAGRVQLTRGMGVHVLNNVPLVGQQDTVTFPFMVAPASTQWEPIAVRGFVGANESQLEQGQHAVRVQAPGSQVVLGELDWDASLFGVAVGPHRLGKHAFVRFEEGNLTLFARVVGVEDDREGGDGSGTLWLVPEKWNADCKFELKDWACKASVTRAGAGAVALTTAARLWPDSPVYQEFLLGVLQSGPGGDLMDPSSWRMSRLVGNPVMRYPQAHRLWAGPAIQERSAAGSIRRCTGTGVRECIYWQEPVAFGARGRAGRVHVAVRITTDQNCNSALLCTLPEGGEQLDCDRFAGVPGFGNVRGYVFYDNVTRFYWALNNFNVDSTQEGSGKGFRREGQRCFDQRGHVGLFYSGDSHNWVLAKAVTKASSNKLALPYSSCTVQQEDLVCVGKTNGNLSNVTGCIVRPDGNHHSSRVIVAFRVRNFRELVL